MAVVEDTSRRSAMRGSLPISRRRAGTQSVGQRIGERREEHPRIAVGAGEMHGPVEGDDRLARSRRSGDAHRTAEGALHELALRRMEKDRPLLPRRLQRALQLLPALDDAEPPLRVGVLEGVHVRRQIERQRRQRRAGGQIQQRLGRLARQPLREVEQRALRRRADVVHPFRRHAVAEKHPLLRIGEQPLRGLPVILSCGDGEGPPN